eukprot:jgi/Mesvir1/27278/Mv26379-RA.1
MRSTFGYQRRAGEAGSLSFAKCSGLINRLLSPTLGISAKGAKGNSRGGGYLEISKADMHAFLDRYKPSWWGDEKDYSITSLSGLSMDEIAPFLQGADK